MLELTILRDFPLSDQEHATCSRPFYDKDQDRILRTSIQQIDATKKLRRFEDETEGQMQYVPAMSSLVIVVMTLWLKNIERSEPSRGDIRKSTPTYNIKLIICEAFNTFFLTSNHQEPKEIPTHNS